MKSPQRVLKEWVADRISFKIDGKRMYFSRVELATLIDWYFRRESLVERFDTSGQRWEHSFFVQYEMFELYRAINLQKNRKWLDARNFARFVSVEEMGDFFGVEV